MDKNASHAPAGSNPSTGDGLDAKLAPLDEFRERAESWMKEITAQVARLAGRSEDEERRKKALDKRLSDIEERMQSLLTLTEMVSQSKNPFATPAKAPEVPRPAASDTPNAGPVAAQPPLTPAPVEFTRVVESEDLSEDPVRPIPLEEAGPEERPMPAPAGSRDPPRLHPNDASGEAPMSPPSVPAAPSIRPRSAIPATPATPRRPPAIGASGPRERFLILEWGRLLAPVAYRIDLGAFLGFYVEAGWVSSEIAATVRNLSLQLRHEEAEDAEPYRLEELHARSIVLVSQLDGHDEAIETAKAGLNEAREVATGGWATASR